MSDTKVILEHTIETTVCRYAKDKGWIVYKFSNPYHRGVPDRIFITPYGKIIFIEFKSSIGKLGPSQIREHDRLKKHNVIIHVINDITKGKELIDAYCQ